MKFVKKHGVGSGRIGSFIFCVFWVDGRLCSRHLSEDAWRTSFNKAAHNASSFNSSNCAFGNERQRGNAVSGSTHTVADERKTRSCNMQAMR